MAIGDKEIAVAVVVDIDKARAPRQIGYAALAQASEKGLIDKGTVAEVFVERIGLPLEVGDKEIGKTIVVVIAHIDAHPRLDIAVLVVGGTGQQALFGEAARAVVDIEEVQGLVVGQVEIGIAVEIDIAEDDA